MVSLRDMPVQSWNSIGPAMAGRLKLLGKVVIDFFFGDTHKWYFTCSNLQSHFHLLYGQDPRSLGRCHWRACKEVQRTYWICKQLLASEKGARDCCKRRGWWIDQGTLFKLTKGIVSGVYESTTDDHVAEVNEPCVIFSYTLIILFLLIPSWTRIEVVGPASKERSRLVWKQVSSYGGLF